MPYTLANAKVDSPSVEPFGHRALARHTELEAWLSLGFRTSGAGPFSPLRHPVANWNGGRTTELLLRCISVMLGSQVYGYSLFVRAEH